MALVKRAFGLFRNSPRTKWATLVAAILGLAGGTEYAVGLKVLVEAIVPFLQAVLEKAS